MKVCHKKFCIDETRLDRKKFDHENVFFDDVESSEEEYEEIGKEYDKDFERAAKEVPNDDEDTQQFGDPTLKFDNQYGM